MPFYEYECQEHGELLVRQPMFAEHTANCPKCGKLVVRRFSVNFRIAEPFTVYQDLGGVGDRQRGYQEIDWKPDSGISHKPGQPVKTAREVIHEEEDSRNKEIRNATSSR